VAWRVKNHHGRPVNRDTITAKNLHLASEVVSLNIMRLFAKRLFLLLTIAIPAAAQEPPTTTLKIATSVVEVPASVHDKTGKPITDLTRDKFLLEQDRKPQPIRYFSQGSDLPLTLALLIDISNSQKSFIPDEIAAGRVFFRSMLTRPEDRAALVDVDCDIRAVKPTSSVPALETALSTLPSRNVRNVCMWKAGGTLLFDAVVVTSQQELSNQAGRRAMVLLTDGGDEGSRHKVEDAIETAQRGDTIIYSVYYSNGSDFGGNKKALEAMARETGGRVFTVTPAMPLQTIFLAIADDLRRQYEIGFRAPDLRPNRYHTIGLKTTDNNLVVNARKGYFTHK
jgi:Ca-activated chloride channel homolog